MRRISLALTLCLSPLITQAGGLGEMTPAEKDAFRAEVRQYLLENPEVIIEAMAAIQQNQHPRLVAQHLTAFLRTRRTAVNVKGVAA